MVRPLKESNAFLFVLLHPAEDLAAALAANADLREMVEEENENVIICPGCRHTRVLMRQEKNSIRERFFAGKGQTA